MDTVSVAEAKAHLGTLLSRVAAGDEIAITRRGKVVARLTAPVQPKRKIDIDALRRCAETMPYQAESAGDFVRRMRDGDRY